MELEVIVGDDDEAGREPLGLRVEHGEAGHEGLPAAVAAAQELDGALAVPREVELPVQFPALLLDADRERVKTPLRHEALAQRLEDVLDVLLGQCAHPLPSRTYRFTPATTSIRTAKGAFWAWASNWRAKRRRPRGPPSIAAASFSVTAPCAARCSNTCRTPGSGNCSSHLVSGCRAGRRRGGGRWRGRPRRGDGEAGVRHARHHVRDGARMVDLDERARVRGPGEPEEQLEGLADGGDDRAAGDPRPATRLAELDLHVLGVGDAHGELDLLRASEVQRLLREGLDPGLDAVHPRHALAGLGGDAVPDATAASRRAVHHGEHRDDALLQAVAAMREAHRPPGCVEDRRALREDHARPRALVPEVRERDPDLARAVGRHRREDMPPLRVDPAAISLDGCGVIVQQEEPVVGGEHEPAHARLAQHAPGRAELLQGKVEHGGADTLLPGLVDLPAVHHDQPRLRDRPLQRGQRPG